MPSASKTRAQSSVLRNNFRLLVEEGLVSVPIVYLTLPGNFIIAALLTQIFGLSDTAYGVITSLPAWCNVLQVFVMPFLSARFTQKRLNLSFVWGQVAAWFALVWVLPHLPVDNERVSSTVFFWVFFAISLAQSLIAISWTSWLQEWMPGQLRGKFFGFRNRWLQVATVIFLFASGIVLERLHAISPIESYQLIICLFIFLRVIAIFLQERIHTPPNIPPPPPQPDWIQQLAIVRDSTGLKAFMLAGAAWGLTSGFFGPFFNRFMLEGLQLTVADISRLVMITTISGAISAPFWGKMNDRFGCRPVMIFCLIAWMSPGFIWSFLTPETTWILYPMWISGGIASSGFMLGMFNMLLKIVPEDAKTTAISVNVAITATVTAIAPILGGSLLDFLWRSGFDRLHVYQAMSFIHHGLILSVVPWLLHRVPEPQSRSVGDLIGAMRSYREISSMLGLSFLGNFASKRTRN